MGTVISDNMKLRLLKIARNEYFDLQKHVEVIQASGISLQELSKFLSISRRTTSRLINQSFRKNSIFFKHFMFITIVNELYELMPDKERRKAERKIERKKRKASTVNRVIYRPETDKQLSVE